MTPICLPALFNEAALQTRVFPNPSTCKQHSSPTKPKASLSPQGSSAIDCRSVQSPCCTSLSLPLVSFVAPHFPNSRHHLNLQDFPFPLLQSGIPYLVFSVYLNLLHSWGAPQTLSAPGTLPQLLLTLVKLPSQTGALGPS